MENFDWTCFTVKSAVKTDMKTIYDAWTIPSEIKKWFLESAKYLDSENKTLDYKSNYTAPCSYEWRWYNYGETEKGKVLETNGTDFIAFTFAGNCRVEVQLSSYEDYTIIAITQKDIPTDDASKKNVRLGCHGGWSYFLENIKSVYENGNDLRIKDAGLHKAINKK